MGGRLLACWPCLPMLKRHAAAELLTQLGAPLACLAALPCSARANSLRPLAAAVLASGVAGADERRVAEVMGAIADRVCDQFQRPYTFPSFHERILQPYNYYDFGQARPLAAQPVLAVALPQRPELQSTPSPRALRLQNYVRNLVDFRSSVVGHLEHFDRVAAYLAAGDNVVMLANHQTEADPGAHPLLPPSAHSLARRGVCWCCGHGERSGWLPCQYTRHPAYQETLHSGLTQAAPATQSCNALQLHDLYLSQAAPSSSIVNAAAVGEVFYTWWVAMRAADAALIGDMRAQRCGRCCWRARTRAWPRT